METIESCGNTWKGTEDMNILVIGGTRFFGIPMIEKLIEEKHQVTVATRGNTNQIFGDGVSYIFLDRTNPVEVKKKLGGKKYDVIIDKVAYCSNDVKHLLDYVSCDRYILMSTCSVYDDIHENITEDEFDPVTYPLEWLDRLEDYARIKKSAECAVAQVYNKQAYTFVRYPVVIGEHDYTKRLYFYVDHIVNGKAMKIADPDISNTYIDEKAAGEFMAYLVEHPVDGPVNGCMSGMISLREIIQYIEERTGKKAVFSEDGEETPLDDLLTNRSICTKVAENVGYHFAENVKGVKEVLDLYLTKQG